MAKAKNEVMASKVWLESYQYQGAGGVCDDDGWWRAGRKERAKAPVWYQRHPRAESVWEGDRYRDKRTATELEREGGGRRGQGTGRQRGRRAARQRERGGCVPG